MSDVVLRGSGGDVATTYELAHSEVVVQETPEGPVGRVERDDRVEYAVLAPETVAAMEAIAR